MINQYEKAIYRVGDVLSPYDSDQSFPVYGFGGEPKFMNVAGDDYCFPLNGSKEDPAIQGIGNVVVTYRKTLPAITFLDGTRFVPVLQRFKEYVIKAS